MITKQTKFIGGISAVLFICVVGALVVGVYVITTQGERLQTQMALLADVTEQQRSYNEIERILENSAQERELVKTFFLTEADTIDFLATIEQTARARGIELTTDALRVDEPKDAPATLTINFSVAGQPAAVRQFITILETLPYGSYITNLELGVNRDTGLSDAKVSVAILLLPTV